MNNNQQHIMHIITYKGLCIHIFAECLLWAWCPWRLWPCGVHGCVPATTLTCKWHSIFIINMLHFMVKFYDDGSFFK